MPEGAHPECFGPYLRYAIWKEFANFVFFHQDHHSVFLLIELKKPGSMAEFADALKKSNLTVEFGPGEEHSRYVTMIADKAVVLDSSTFDAWNKYVDRVELSLPIRPGNREFASVKKLAERWDQGQTTPGTLVIGLLDDGCPFAAAQFLNVSATGAVSTRVRAIWDQNQGKQPIEIDKAGTKFCFGEKLTDFNYGLEYRRDSVGQQIGLDEWIQRYRTSIGSIEEQRCYSDGDFTRLASRVSHGAHVMDVFAGRIPTSSRIGDHRNPPSWAVGDPNTDPACGVDLVFVQFPLSCIRDATGVWLKCYVVNGIRYILSCADPQTTKNVIVNLSYGPTTGPHDGTHDLETAIAELVAEYDGSGGKPKLEVVLAAGNSYLREEHVKFKNEHTGLQDIEWIWRLSADNSVLCFCEVWMEANEVDAAVTVTITPPGGAARVISSQPWGTSTMWLLNVGPTVVPAPLPYTASEPHGDYTIKVTGIRAGAEVHAYVARSDPNMGVVTGAKRSYFVDPNWVGTHSAAASCTYADGEFDRSGSRIHRDGTLNGIATAKVSSVHVAGGYIIANGRKSPYSSAGPARGGPRVGPDYLLPCDESYALKGIRAGGNRSGAVFRLVGTSVAAPELARQVVKLVSGLPLPTPTNVPTSPGEIAKGGGGNIEPP